MAKYKLAGERLEESGVIRIADGAAIPADESNRDWRAFLEWQNEGNTPDPQFTPEEMVTQQRQELLLFKQQEMTGFDRQLLKLVAIMYQVGKEKGLWGRLDFTSIDPNIIDRVQALRQKLSEIEDLENA